ncbi:major outer envelope glycoprotein [Azobacteroides phage ProJPt-Bp1]|uniref:Major outer envelope glycoprotein n=1 Tax=Azobacteroides phage ProJPt-Bp1 TaxID=1920526 RepID=A0A1V1FGX5_9CAUD|nr:major outer envelope glycoprotein [Azobacteroides phage ProJPt-Bp1]BAX03421.1 major outer envelope glycoprotein [Azobacteroides phage ProJPt-Bp1]
MAQHIDMYDIRIGPDKFIIIDNHALYTTFSIEFEIEEGYIQFTDDLVGDVYIGQIANMTIDGVAAATTGEELADQLGDYMTDVLSEADIETSGATQYDFVDDGLGFQVKHENSVVYDYSANKLVPVTSVSTTTGTGRINNLTTGIMISHTGTSYIPSLTIHSGDPAMLFVFKNGTSTLVALSSDGTLATTKSQNYNTMPNGEYVTKALADTAYVDTFASLVGGSFTVTRRGNIIFNYSAPQWEYTFNNLSGGFVVAKNGTVIYTYTPPVVPDQDVYTFADYPTTSGFQVSKNSTPIYTYSAVLDTFTDEDDGFKVARGGSTIYTYTPPDSAVDTFSDNDDDGFKVTRDGQVIYNYDPPIVGGSLDFETTTDQYGFVTGFEVKDEEDEVLYTYADAQYGAQTIGTAMNLYKSGQLVYTYDAAAIVGSGFARSIIKSDSGDEELMISQIADEVGGYTMALLQSSTIGGGGKRTIT